MPPRSRRSRSMYGRRKGTRRRSSRARRMYGGKRRSRKYSGRNLRGGQPIRVYVKYQYKNADRTYETRIGKDDTFGEWKEFMFRQSGVYPDLQKYVHKGEQLKDNGEPLSKIVKDGDTLHLIVGRDAPDDWGEKLKLENRYPDRRIPGY